MNNDLDKYILYKTKYLNLKYNYIGGVSIEKIKENINIIVNQNLMCFINTVYHIIALIEPFIKSLENSKGINFNSKLLSILKYIRKEDRFNLETSIEIVRIIDPTWDTTQQDSLFFLSRFLELLIESDDKLADLISFEKTELVMLSEFFDPYIAAYDEDTDINQVYELAISMNEQSTSDEIKLSINRENIIDINLEILEKYYNDINVKYNNIFLGMIKYMELPSGYPPDYTGKDKTQSSKYDKFSNIIIFNIIHPMNEIPIEDIQKKTGRVHEYKKVDNIDKLITEEININNQIY